MAVVVSNPVDPPSIADADLGETIRTDEEWLDSAESLNHYVALRPDPIWCSDPLDLEITPGWDWVAMTWTRVPLELDVQAYHSRGEDCRAQGWRSTLPQIYGTHTHPAGSPSLQSNNSVNWDDSVDTLAQLRAESLQVATNGDLEAFGVIANEIPAASLP